MKNTAVHEIKNILHRLELMTDLLYKEDFSNFSKDEIKTDLAVDLKKLSELMQDLSNDQ